MPGHISHLGLITFQFTFLSLSSSFFITILKELLAYMLLYERKGNRLCFCSRKYTFVPPAWLSVIKERMWLNFPRLGFTSTVVYTVQKSFYTSKFFLFLIFFSFMANDPFSGPEVLPLMFQMPFSFIYLCMKFVSMKQKVIFHTQCVLSLNRTLPGVSVLWGLMFDCIMHTQILFFIANKILLARQRKSSSCSFLLLSLSLLFFIFFSFYTSV